MRVDMTTGSPYRKLLQFALPIFAGNLFMQLYYVTDSIIVGHTLGETALGAVGTTGTLSFLLFGLISGMTAGFTIHTAQRHGASDPDGVRRSAASAITLAAVITAVFTLVGGFSMRTILQWMHTPDDMFRDAYRYIWVIYVGLGAQVAYQLLSSLLRAIGDSRMPLIFLVISAALNIVLDLLLICVFHMGTEGAALATILSQAISALCSLLYILGRVPLLHLRASDFRPDWSIMSRQLRIGIPMTLQYSITAIGTTMVQVSLNMLDSPMHITAFTAASKIENLAGQAHPALGTASATYAAQNAGARKPDRICRGFRASTIMGCTYAILAGIPLILWGKYLTVLFVPDAGTALMDAVGTYLTCGACFTFSLVIVNTYRNGLQGVGYSFLPMVAGIVELIGRGTCSLISIRHGSYLLICLATPTAWTMAAIFLLCAYFYAKKRSFQ